MRIFVASLALVSLATIVQPCFADDSDKAQDNSGTAAYSLAAAPVYFAEGSAYAASAGAKRIVKLVDKTGKAIGELTSDTIDEVKTGPDASDTPKVTLDQKQIPLAVRGDYVQMNEKVQPE
ncbi:MAG TPA: hypothetical protein V6C69_19180 [Trichormus sp.]|jgi:hypothetical protein